MRDFEKILSTLGGDGERERAKELLQKIEVVPDVTSPRLANLFMCRKIKARLPDGHSQILRLYVFGPSGLRDYGSATLRCKI